MLLNDFRDWLLVHQGHSADTVPPIVGRIDFLVRQYSLDLHAFHSDPAAALRHGTRILAQRKREGKLPAVRNSRTALNHLAEFAGHEGVHWRPMGDRQDHVRGEIYTRGQVRRAMATYPMDRWQLQDLAMFEYNIATGLRRGEVHRTTEAHVDVDEAEYQVKHPTKRGQRRRLPFADSAILDDRSYFMQWLQERPHCDQNRQAIWIHPDRRPMKREELGSRMYLLRRKLAFDTSFQRGRAYFATELWRQGMRVAAIQQALGHAKRTTTERYLHIQFVALGLEIERVRPTLRLRASEADLRLAARNDARQAKLEVALATA